MDQKIAQSPKLYFLVRDTFQHWLFATKEEFDAMQTIRKLIFEIMPQIFWPIAYQNGCFPYTFKYHDMMWKFIIYQQKKEKNPNRCRNSMSFPILGLLLDLTDRKMARSPKLYFILRDTFNYWLSATQKKFDLDDIIAKNRFLEFCLRFFGS